MLKTAAAYIRVSTDDQLEYSPDSQLEVIRKYAKANDYIIPDEHIYIEEGISGRTANKRPQFIKMLESQRHSQNLLMLFFYGNSAVLRITERNILYLLKHICINLKSVVLSCRV